MAITATGGLRRRHSSVKRTQGCESGCDVRRVNDCTRYDISHIPVVHGRRYIRNLSTFTLTLMRKGLEDADRGTVNVARQECDADTLYPCDALELLNEPISFLLKDSNHDL